MSAASHYHCYRGVDNAFFVAMEFEGNLTGFIRREWCLCDDRLHVILNFLAGNNFKNGEIFWRISKWKLHFMCFAYWYFLKVNFRRLAEQMALWHDRKAFNIQFYPIFYLQFYYFFCFAPSLCNPQKIMNDLYFFSSIWTNLSLPGVHLKQRLFFKMETILHLIRIWIRDWKGFPLLESMVIIPCHKSKFWLWKNYCRQDRQSSHLHLEVMPPVDHILKVISEWSFFLRLKSNHQTTMSLRR